MSDLKQTKQAIYDLHVQLTRGLHDLVDSTTIEELEKCAAAYLQTMRMEDGEPIEVDRGPLKQMATLAMYSLSRFMNEKYKLEGRKK